MATGTPWTINKPGREHAKERLQEFNTRLDITRSKESELNLATTPTVGATSDDLTDFSGIDAKAPGNFLAAHALISVQTHHEVDVFSRGFR